MQMVRRTGGAFLLAPPAVGCLLIWSFSGDLALGWRLTMIAIARFLGYCDSDCLSFSTTVKRLLVGWFDAGFVQEADIEGKYQS